MHFGICGVGLLKSWPVISSLSQMIINHESRFRKLLDSDDISLDIFFSISCACRDENDKSFDKVFFHAGSVAQ